MAFIKRILVPTDFSEPATNALRYAQILAGLTQAEVKVLHIFNVPVVDPYMPGDTLELLMQEVKAGNDAKMEELLKSFPGITGESMHGFVIDDINRFAEEWEADLIVMGTTGASGAKEAFFGSNASGVLSHSHVKTLSIPESYTNQKAPSKICYASDFTGNEELSFRIFVNLAKAWDCSLDILHIVSDELVFTSAQANDMYTKIAAGCNFDRMEFAEIKSNEVTAAIETFVQTNGTDILGMAVHHRNILERIFSKSKTKAIANHAQIPLLSIRKN